MKRYSFLLQWVNDSDGSVVSDVGHVIYTMLEGISSALPSRVIVSNYNDPITWFNTYTNDDVTNLTGLYLYNQYDTDVDFNVLFDLVPLAIREQYTATNTGGFPSGTHLRATNELTGFYADLTSSGSSVWELYTDTGVSKGSLYDFIGMRNSVGIGFVLLDADTGDITQLTPAYVSVSSTTGSNKSRLAIQGGAGYIASELALEWLNGIEPMPEPPQSTDPYESGAGGSSSTGGGTGTFSETGDTVGIPGLPSLSAVDTGFITLFNPTVAQVKQLASYMWSNSFDLATFKNIVANPIDCILGLTIVPVDPPNAGSKSVSVGNIPTGVNMPYLSSQYVEVDCGTLNVQEFWGSYLDYSPYTKMSLYLPYIGIVPLDIDDVMNASITIKYHVDVLSGACVAYVLCNGTQLYTYIGQCSSNVPITSNDFTNTVNGILGIAGSIGSLVATGGASAPTEIGNMAGNAINALKPNIQKSGAMSGTGGLMGVQTPYLICQRPRQSVPASQNTFTGYPANITATLSDLSGYTEVDKIHLEGVPCTNEEMNEIMTLLESGVYI